MSLEKFIPQGLCFGVDSWRVEGGFFQRMYSLVEILRQCQIYQCEDDSVTESIEDAQ